MPAPAYEGRHALGITKLRFLMERRGAAKLLVKHVTPISPPPLEGERGSCLRSSNYTGDSELISNADLTHPCISGGDDDGDVKDDT